MCEQCHNYPIHCKETGLCYECTLALEIGEGS